MRHVSQLKVFICHAAVGIFALAGPASAATFFANVDLTVVTNITGDQSFVTIDDDDGTAGGPAIFWDADGVDVIISSGLTMTGGAGGPGGADASNNGGNIGGFGGAGLYMWKNAGSVTGSGVFVYGGAGGVGSGGGSGGGSDTAGGIGGDGGIGIYLDKTNQITLTNSVVQGGKGANGGDAGDAAGDAANTAKGGVAGQGGAGIALIGSSNAVVTLNNVAVKGGDGASGGTSLANATNANGGSGGFGFAYFGTDATITLGTGTTVQGGLGGAAGTGGAGGVAGNDGLGFLYGGLGGSLTNHGTILSGGEAIALDIEGTPALIDNHGMIGAASGQSGNAVYIGSSGNVGTFTNHAGASILSSGNAPSVSVEGAVAEFVNDGLIANSGSGAVYLSGFVGAFTNSGTIQSVNGAALRIGSAAVADTIVNTGGLITNLGATSTVQIWADLGVSGIAFSGGEIENQGGSIAVHVIEAQLGNISITNALVTSDSHAVKFDNAGETLIVASSTLDGDVTFTGTGNNLNFDAGTTALSPSTQVNNASFVTLLAGANVVSNAEQTDANSSIGTLTTIAGSALTLNADMFTDGAVLNEGTLTLAAGAALNATGAFTSTGTIVFGVANDGTAGQIHSLNGIDLTGSTIEIALANPANTFVSGTNILLGSDFDLGAIDGLTNGTLLADNSALMEFYLYRGDASEIGGNAYQFFAQVQAALLADIAGEGDDPNAIALGAALDEIGLSGDADLDDLMLALALLPTNGDINAMIDALLPETDGVAYDIATDLGDQALDVASKRLDTLQADRLDGSYRVASVAPIALRGSVSDVNARGRFWLQGFGRAVDQSQHGYNTGYDAGSYGVAVGADTRVDHATAVGVAFSYTTTDADGNGVNQTDTEVDSYQLTLYGDHLFGNAVYAKGLLAYGWHANEIVRHDVGGILGKTAMASYDADHVSGRIEAGRAYRGGASLTLIPRAHLNAAWYSPDGYAEQGVGGLGLVVAPDDLTSVRLGLGVLARWDVALSGGALFRPELRVDYRRDLTQARFETASEFLGAPGIMFRTQGVEPAADILNLGVGALLATAGGVDFRASYDLELKEDYTAHAGYVRASIPF